MMQKYIFLLLWITSVHSAHAQKHGRDYIRIMFYNVENFFDTANDSLTEDDEFTPGGEMHWTQKRYTDKRNNIFRIIAGIGQWDPPAIVGLCEIENRKVLENLIKNTPLQKYPYRIIHNDSPDRRGIDVAMLYRSDYLKCIGKQFIKVRFDSDSICTRDILYATFHTHNDDTLHVFVNHWPSRVDGKLRSEHKRMLAASMVRQKADSIFNKNPMANIIITGDMNDSPTDRSVASVLQAVRDTAQEKHTTLFNLSAYRMNEVTGTVKYQGKWSVFDQIIVSGGLLRGALRTDVSQCQIFRTDYLFEPDNRYQSVKPFRTYIWVRYNNGFSDHLPVYVDVILHH